MFKFLRKLLNQWPSRKAIERPEDDDLSWLFPPSEVHAAKPWDNFWKAQLENGVGPQLHDFFCDDDDLLQAIEARGLSSVLCVGSGISQEPHALAAAGLKVVAMDISPFAMDFARSLSLEPAQIQEFFDQARIRLGGTVEFVTGDLMDPTICPGPFDVVIERRTLQVFPADERPAALKAVAARLTPAGILLTHCHDGAWRPPKEPVHVVEPLLDSCGFKVETLGSDTHSFHRTAFVFTTTG